MRTSIPYQTIRAVRATKSVLAGRHCRSSVWKSHTAHLESHFSRPAIKLHFSGIFLRVYRDWLLPPPGRSAGLIELA